MYQKWVTSTFCTLKMEVKEGERIIIAKPVASRPTCSKFFSFSELLAGTTNISPSSACSKTADTVIRPKTVRLRPVVNHAPVGLIFSQPKKSEVPGYKSSTEVLKSFNKPTVVHKPLAKLASKTNVSLLANLENSSTNHQEELAQVEAHAQLNNQVLHHLRSDFSSDLHQNFASQSESEKTIEPSKIESNNLEEDQKSLHATGNGDRSSYDGYNWRKYGQKQVKGSEHPRSYYKCTHLNCPVKKKVEQSLDGQITEIVYMGEHSHSKPRAHKRNSSGGQGEGFMSDGTVDNADNLLLYSQLDEKNEGSEAKIKNQSETGLSAHSTYPGKVLISFNLVTTGTFEAGVTAHDSSYNSADFEEVSKGLEAEVDEPKSKRRKNVNQSDEAGVSREDVQEPHMVVQSSNDSEIMRDGFRWRKYGQKVVKGNPYPRSYYRCTSPNCNVRKHIERVSGDPRTFITTYEGKHNHDMPIKNTNQVASEPPSKAVQLPRTNHD